jgi:hypothetical protein
MPSETEILDDSPEYCYFFKKLCDEQEALYEEALNRSINFRQEEEAVSLEISIKNEH